MKIARCVVFTAAVLLLALCIASAERPPRSELGRSVKFTLLVDKVMQPEAGWHTEEWMVQEAAEAGFNVWSPRLGHNNLAEVLLVNEWCRKYEIFHIPWMRGTLTAPDGAEADGKRVVWSSGSEQPLWSPNSDEFWNWTTNYIVEYAKMAADDDTIIGVFLDYENYAPGLRGGNLYDLSYDDIIMGMFADDQGIELPELRLADRASWLEDEGLTEAFSEFQINHWRERCRTLREAVDEWAPEFQFCIYPAPGTLFMTAATYPEWATEAAPLILADASIYGRPGIWANHEEALAENEAKLTRNMEWALEQPGGPYMYAGGLDPVVTGADPEFSGRNAVMSSELTDGYWIFYEGPTYDGTHRDYFNWFTRANEAIAAENWDFWGAERETPDSAGALELIAETDKPQIVVSGTRPHLIDTIESFDTWEVHPMEGVELSYLEGADVVLLQNFNQEWGPGHPFVMALREYVENGGGLLIGHDTGWFMASPFEGVATRGYPTKKVEAVRHVVNTDLVTDNDHPALGDITPRTIFSTEFNDHMIFEPGPNADVIIRNIFRDPVYVAGEVEKGRVIFSGCYYGYHGPLEGTERDVLENVLRWLGGLDE